jgi:hypothetical protein
MIPSIILKSIRKFSTTEPKKLIIPPIIWIIFKPISKSGAILFGRSFRKWWNRLPKDIQSVFKNHIKRNAKIYFSLISGSSMLTTGFYLTHIEAHPITGRKRFIYISDSQLNEIENFGFNQVVIC